VERKTTRILVIDGTNLFYRAYHGLIHQQFQFDGHPTWAVFGLLNTIASSIKIVQPTHVLVAFDYGKSAYRREIYPEYKAGRHDATPFIDFEDVNNQLQQSQHLLKSLGLQVWQEKGIEADDIIATVVDRYESEVDEIVILTGDKDLRQLISRKTYVIHPSLGKKAEERWDYDRVADHYGVVPERLIEIWALSGDKADNIPGIKGIGEKTAIKYIAKYGNISSVLLSDEKRVVGHESDVHMSYKLVQLNSDLSNMDLSLEDIRFLPVGPKDEGAPEVRAVLKQNGFERLMNRWTSGTLWTDRGIRLKDLKHDSAE